MLSRENEQHGCVCRVDDNAWNNTEQIGFSESADSRSTQSLPKGTPAALLRLLCSSLEGVCLKK